MQISVLDVADGACSVLRPSRSRYPGELTVIDCGSTGISARTAMLRLLDEINFRPWEITTIVVTHFDADHYEGFLCLAEYMKCEGMQFPKLNLIAPRLPDAAGDYLLSYMALITTMSGLRSLDLVKALRDVTVKNQFSYTPVVRGGPDFSAAYSKFSVHWPPYKMPNRVAGEVQTAMDRFKELADELKARNLPDLDNNLKAAREGLWANTRLIRSDSEQIDEGIREDELSEEVQQVEEAKTEGSTEQIDDGKVDDELSKDDQKVEEMQAEADTDEDEENDNFQFSSDVNIPTDLQEKFKKAKLAFNKANNNMSIVFDDRHSRHLVVFGDAGPRVVNWISQRKELANTYEVMLAPHHGTHCLPPAFATNAWICISQNGYKREHKWRENHLSTHKNFQRCKSTWAGNFHIFTWPLRIVRYHR